MYTYFLPSNSVHLYSFIKHRIATFSIASTPFNTHPPSGRFRSSKTPYNDTSLPMNNQRVFYHANEQSVSTLSYHWTVNDYFIMLMNNQWVLNHANEQSVSTLSLPMNIQWWPLTATHHYQWTISEYFVSPYNTSLPMNNQWWPLIATHHCQWTISDDPL